MRGVAGAAAGHADVGRRGAGVLAEDEVPRGGGVALHGVNGVGVAELDTPMDIVSRQGPCAVGAGDGEAAVPVDSGDGPGVTVRDVEAVVVAAGGDAVPGAEALPGGGGRCGVVPVVDPAGDDQPIPDGGVKV